MHSVKQQRKREEEVIEIDGLQLLLPDRGKDGASGREYEPPHLENSLGKLQVVSVNAPRKIIDLQVVHLDPSHPTTSMQREMRRHRHLLLYVEKVRRLCDYFVRLQEGRLWGWGLSHCVEKLTEYEVCETKLKL